MDKCPHCGKDLCGNKIVCPHCGMSITTLPAKKETPPNNTYYADDSQKDYISDERFDSALNGVPTIGFAEDIIVFAEVLAAVVIAYFVGRYLISGIVEGYIWFDSALLRTWQHLLAPFVIFIFYVIDIIRRFIMHKPLMQSVFPARISLLLTLVLIILLFAYLVMDAPAMERFVLSAANSDALLKKFTVFKYVYPFINIADIVFTSIHSFITLKKAE